MVIPAAGLDLINPASSAFAKIAFTKRSILTALWGAMSGA